MKIGQPKLILNPYEWLPGYGESKLSFRSIGADVILDIEYERDVSGVEGADIVQNLKREIAFVSVRAFMRVPFPKKWGQIYFSLDE